MTMTPAPENLPERVLAFLEKHGGWQAALDYVAALEAAPLAEGREVIALLRTLPTKVETLSLSGLNAEECAIFDSGYNACLDRVHLLLTASVAPANEAPCSLGSGALLGASDATPTAQRVAAGDEWRCFHCDERFTDSEAAAVHFGTHEHQRPACLIDAAEYRRMEAKEARYAEEDADCHRALYRQQSEHQAALRRAEEAGYAKGLRDSGQCPCATPSAARAEGPDAMELDNAKAADRAALAMIGQGYYWDGNAWVQSNRSREAAAPPRGGEPVGETVNFVNGMSANGFPQTIIVYKSLPAGMKLYTHPADARGVDDAMVERAIRAWLKARWESCFSRGGIDAPSDLNAMRAALAAALHPEGQG